MLVAVLPLTFVSIARRSTVEDEWLAEAKSLSLDARRVETRIKARTATAAGEATLRLVITLPGSLSAAPPPGGDSPVSSFPHRLWSRY
jgi:hypothetical protein